MGDLSVDVSSLPESARLVLDRLKSAGHEAYLVGGCVRDLIRGVPPGDYDIVTSAVPDAVMAIFPHTIPVGMSFGVVLVIEQGKKYEVAAFRREDGYVDGRRPTSVSPASAEEDVRRRDFTINGLLLDHETGRLLDYVGGMADIERRLVRTIGGPRQRFAEDHLRLLRAVRFAASLGYQIEPETLTAIKVQAGTIRRISAERIREELTKIITRPGARRGMELLAETGLLREILPEVEALVGVEQPPQFHPEGDVWEHALLMLSLLPTEAAADPCLAWGVILHDLGKAVTRTVDDKGVHFYGHVQRGEEIARQVMERLRFSNEDLETVLALIHCHMLFMNVREMRPSRLKRFLRLPDFPLHLELHRLDCLGSHGLLDNYEFCRTKLIEIPAGELRPPRLITGHDLIDMGYKPGPLFAGILQDVEDAQLNGLIFSADDARRLVQERFGAELAKG
ncbi:MAG: CCA tRNA nucleotidyltransferase [Deltaproteobacteria bacterium]|nr:CCA tRNA nucleotidyltransferase [Deltaproteobacteria bacterium]